MGIKGRGVREEGSMSENNARRDFIQFFSKCIYSGIFFLKRILYVRAHAAKSMVSPGATASESLDFLVNR